MKTLLRLGLATFLGSVGLSTVRADLEVSASVTVRSTTDFDAPLATEGSWVQVRSYGRCWRPGGVVVGWRPYCAGEWVWTDCGWYWESDEPWAWACYHYGNWVWDPVYGWVWVPGVEWAPAWVCWREGGGYIGWAPLPPPGFSFFVRAPAPQFVFVETSRFVDPIRPGAVIVNNTTILNRTTVINNVRRETRNIGGTTSQRVIVNEGPGTALVQSATGRKLQALPIREAARRATPVSSFLPRTDIKGQGKTSSPHGNYLRQEQPQDSRGREAPLNSYPQARGENRAPEQSTSPPRGRPSRPPEAQGGGQEHDHHNGEGHGKDRP